MTSKKSIILRRGAKIATQKVQNRKGETHPPTSETKKKLSNKEVVTGSFSVSVKFLMDGIGPLWLSSVYGPNNTILKKDFWVELLDLFGLTFPLWCVKGDFNITKRISEKLGGFGLTPTSMVL